MNRRHDGREIIFSPEQTQNRKDVEIGMGKWNILAAAFSDGADAVPAVAAEISDVLEDFVNMDLFKSLCDSYARMFLIGFAATTLAVLVTFAVSKALSLVRID